MNTIKHFCEQSNIPAKLIRSVIRQMGGWESFKESAEDVTNHGINAGFGAFIYYADTVPFTKRNKGNILTLCKEQSQEYGLSGSVSEFLTGFSCLKDYDISEIEDGLWYANSDHKTAIYNALAGYAAEEVCRAYCDLTEEQAKC